MTDSVTKQIKVQQFISVPLSVSPRDACFLPRGLQYPVGATFPNGVLISPPQICVFRSTNAKIS